jgi:hypothetical protein
MSRSEAFGQNYLVSLGMLPVVLISPLAFLAIMAIPFGLIAGIVTGIQQLRDEYLAIAAAAFTWVGIAASARYIFF